MMRENTLDISIDNRNGFGCEDKEKPRIASLTSTRRYIATYTSHLMIFFLISRMPLLRQLHSSGRRPTHNNNNNNNNNNKSKNNI